MSDNLRNLHSLASEGQPRDGEAPHGAVCAGSGMAVPAAAADMPTARTGKAAGRSEAAGVAGHAAGADGGDA